MNDEQLHTTERNTILDRRVVNAWLHRVKLTGKIRDLHFTHKITEIFLVKYYVVLIVVKQE